MHGVGQSQKESACSRASRGADLPRGRRARVRTDVMLRDLNLAALATDERRIEVIASGLPVYGGAQLAIDVTLRSALGRGGEPRPQTHWRDGAAAEDARADKEAKYPEIASGSRCRLVVLALETGGRFSRETVEFLGSCRARRRFQCRRT